MRIFPSYQTDYKYTAPSFGDCAIKSANSKLTTHFTHIGRDLCVNRVKLTDYVINLLKNPRLGCEFVFCGCSDGSEIFDVMMPLVYNFRKNNIPLDKLPKFRAFDSSQDIINIAQKGRINISNTGVEYITKTYPDYPFFADKKGLLYNPQDNIEYLERTIGSTLKNSYQFNPDLLEKITFYQGDMLSEFQKITPDTCKVVVCRNVARYNPEKYQRDAARALEANLKPNSIVIVGFGDEYNPIHFESRITDINKQPQFFTRLPFTDELSRGHFIYNEKISPTHLVYQKM